jgi:methyl-accepting chemotaxis protein
MRRGFDLARALRAALLKSLIDETGPSTLRDIGRRVARGVGDTDNLMAAMKAMTVSLAGIVGQMRNCSDSIATGSTQIASGNADLSRRTEQQASALQQIAASMEQHARLRWPIRRMPAAHSYNRARTWLQRFYP